MGDQQEATYAAGRVYVTDFNTKEKAISDIYAPKRVKIKASVVKI
jgi:hypothetical protein